VLGAVLVQPEPVRVVLGHHGIIGADLLDEAAIARAAGIGHDNPIERTLLGAAAGETNFQGHLGFLLFAVCFE
jgi:hypothetical protein